jgi:hypothetical protein
VLPVVSLTIARSPRNILISSAVFTPYAMGESRQELLAWANQLLQLNLTKVEQYVYHRACEKMASTNRDTDLAQGTRHPPGSTRKSVEDCADIHSLQGCLLPDI